MTFAEAGRGRAVLLAVLVALALSLLAPLAQPARAQGPRVLLAEIDGVIDRTTVDYMTDAFAEAASGYAAIVVRFNTPGGDLDSTIQIFQMMIHATNMPVLGWVGPPGASAASAGTILLEWTDLAAMAPGTSIGSVQPVQLGPTGFTPITDSKIINYVEEQLANGMALHGRNVALASEFVERNLNLNATAALSLRATDLVAASVTDLLAQANGRPILVQEDGNVVKDLTVNVAGAEVVTFGPSARVQFLGLLSDPLIASLLLILGIYLLIFGFHAPGHGAEVAGIIVVLLALIGLGFSVDPIALLLIIIGVVLLIAEAKHPGFGAFGIGGIAAIALGTIFLAPLRPPHFAVTPAYQLAFLLSLLTPTVAFGIFILFAMYKVQEVRHRKPTIGEPVGESAVVTEPIPKGERGYVRYKGELWQAVSEEDLSPETTVYIRKVDGIVLHVTTESPPAPTRPSVRRRLSGLLGRKPA